VTNVQNNVTLKMYVVGKISMVSGSTAKKFSRKVKYIVDKVNQVCRARFCEKHESRQIISQLNPSFP